MVNNTRKIYRTWLIVQYDDRPIDKFDAEFIKRNRFYAKKHGYHYKFIHTGYTSLPPYWRKVAIVKDFLDSNLYKGVMWLDTDAVIFNMNISLDSLGNLPKHFFKGRDTTGNQIFNAGVWTVKNTKEGKEIMRKWLDLYDASKWEKNGKQWYTHGYWAGNDYEQGAFAYKIDPHHKANISTTSNSTFQGRYDSHKSSDVFVYHFHSGITHNLKARREKFLKENPFPV